MPAANTGELVYLESHPPHRNQFRRQRRAQASGAIVVHTAEVPVDLMLPDAGAERVARFISTRSDAGSYHSISDSDSTVCVGRYEWEMYGEGTGGNRWALHLSFACRAAQWAWLPPQWVDAALMNAALEAASMAAWVKAETGVSVPARRITRAEYLARRPGFISHAELDPGRRSDPGDEFPWDQFLRLFAQLTDQEVSMAVPTSFDDVVWQIQVFCNENYARSEGEELLAVDADFGPATAARVLSTLHQLNHGLHNAKSRNSELLAANGRLDGELEATRAQVEAGSAEIRVLRAELDAVTQAPLTGALTEREVRLLDLGRQVDGLLVTLLNGQ